MSAAIAYVALFALLAVIWAAMNDDGGPTV
jgi:hypothetical protein